jgi:hypothetical protein
MPLMNQSEYARHRGIKQPSVNYAIRTGRISTVEHNGKTLIDSDIADVQWAANAKRVRATAEPGVLAQPKAPAPVPDPPSEASPPPSQDLPADWQRVQDVATSRAKREQFEAQIAEMKAFSLAGTLVERDRTRRAAIDAASALRLAFEHLPTKLASRLAAESSAATIRQLLDTEIRHALAEAVAELRGITSRAGPSSRS